MYISSDPSADSSSLQSLLGISSACLFEVGLFWELFPCGFPPIITVLEKGLESKATPYAVQSAKLKGVSLGAKEKEELSNECHGLGIQ